MSCNSFWLQLSLVVRSPVKCRMRKLASGEAQNIAAESQQSYPDIII